MLMSRTMVFRRTEPLIIVFLVLFVEINTSEASIVKLVSESVTINCLAKNSSAGISSEKIQWKHEGSVLFIDNVKVSKPSNDKLLIKNLDFPDAGQYSCFIGNDTLNVTNLIIQGKPSFTELFSPQTILEGAKLNITCAVKSVPRASIFWQKNGQNVSGITGQLRISTYNKENTLQSVVEILSASYRHNGTYKCIASNTYGTIHHQASVQVYVAAYIIRPPNNTYFARKGASLTLTCSAFGNPIPKLFWHRELANISDVTRYKIEKFTNGFTIKGSLIIKKLKDADSGNYNCLAVNSFSNVQRLVSQVIVQAEPICCQILTTQIGSRAVQITWKPISDGNSVITKYIVTIRDALSVTSRTIELPGRNTTLILNNLSPDTLFVIGIKAENAIGISNASFSNIRTFKERYEKCLKLHVKNIGQRIASVEWDFVCKTKWPSAMIYVDVIVSKGNTVVYSLTYEILSTIWTTSVTGLLPFTEYQVNVRAIPQWTASGWESEAVKFVTAQAAPSVPRNLKTIGKSLTSIEVNWEAPAELNGIIKMYKVTYVDNRQLSFAFDFSKIIDAIAQPKRSLVLENLMINTFYNVSVKERTAPGLWSDAVSIIATTKEGASAPGNVSVSLKNNSTVIVKWSHLSKDDVNGDLLGYIIIASDVQGEVVFNRTVKTNQSEIRINVLQKSAQYDIKVSGLTKAGPGKEVSVRFFTADGVPSVPRVLEATTITSHSIRLRWLVPEKQNGIITSSEIRWRKIINKNRKTRRSVENTKEQSIEIPAATDPTSIRKFREYSITNLSPYNVYSFKVRERTVRGWGPFTDSIEITTKEGASSSPVKLTVISKTSSSVTITWSSPEEPNGEIKAFTIQCFQMSGSMKYQSNITARNSVSHYEGICRNLKSNTETVIQVFAVSTVRGRTGIIKAKTDELSGEFPWIPLIGGCAGFVVVVALLVTTVLICRKRPKYEEVNETFDEIELNGTVKSRPVHISNLKQYVDHNHTNSDHGFFTEYESIKPATAHLTWEHSQEPCNQHKNRYSNIVAYDHTRVILSQVDNIQGSTYINANYVDGYKHPRKFIATQGPLAATVNDFWRMIYEQKCHVIVMLTRIIEGNRVKCEQYWPDHGENEYGNIIVTLVDSTELSDYVVRTFSVNTVFDADKPGQEVKQYHYLGWPDHGVPEYPTSMVTFTKNVMDSVPPKPGPIVVHCSAGVGRTGTLIVIDAMLNQIRDESIVDVYWFNSHIRKQRNFMVQTEAQYVFIYDGLLDAVICGNTEVYAKDLAHKCRYLNQQSPDTGDMYLRQEFKRLEAGISSQEKELFSVANLPENKEKNRFVNILPFNRNRVKLAYIYGVKGSDYMNASFVDGYRQRHVYIATQAPLENTVNDFWRMIWEQNCHNIVMLTKLKEKGQERCYQYWPSCGSEAYGKFLVDNLSECEDEEAHVSQQELNLTYSETGRSRRVNHYLFTGWPDYGSPNSGADIIKLVTLIQQLTSIRGNGPIVVHCSGGAGRTGTFIAICICTQKLKAGGSVDVFQTVRQLRTQRPAMVQTIDQYYFCYQALKDFVGSCDAFTNGIDFGETLA